MQEQSVRVEEFEAFAKVELSPYLRRLGLVIYTSATTLTKNPVLFWGYNPGQDPEIIDTTVYSIRQDLEEFAAGRGSLLDTSWPNTNAGDEEIDGHRVFPVRYEGGEAPYQKGIKKLLKHVGHPDALVANFIFQQTRNVKDARQLPDICKLVQAFFRVHERIFEITDAKVLITAACVKDDLRRYRRNCTNAIITPSDIGPYSGYSRSRVRKFNVELGAAHRRLTLLQVPHMSYWGNIICNQESRKAQVALQALNWVKDEVKKALNEQAKAEG